jgi:hypothetical protein
MLKLFSPCIFAPDGIEIDIERRTVSGGTALNGVEDVVVTDGGGRVYAQFTDPYLDDPTTAKAWRAISAYLDGGSTPIRVRFCDRRHQPDYDTNRVLHSDGTPFDDESEYQQGGISAAVTEAAALRSTSLRITFADDTSLVGGEWFSIDHAFMRDRAYRVAEVYGETIKFRPPLRESVPAGTPLNFADPCCVMRLDGDMRSGTVLGFSESAGVRFVEHFPGPEGY